MGTYYKYIVRLNLHTVYWAILSFCLPMEYVGCVNDAYIFHTTYYMEESW